MRGGTTLIPPNPAENGRAGTNTGPCTGHGEQFQFICADAAPAAAATTATASTPRFTLLRPPMARLSHPCLPLHHSKSMTPRLAPGFRHCACSVSIFCRMTLRCTHVWPALWALRHPFLYAAAWALVAGAVLAGSGCGILRSSGSASIRSVGTGDTLSAALPTRFYSSTDVNSADFFLTDLPRSVWESGADATDMVGMMIHVRMFLSPEPGSTPISTGASTC